MNFRIVETKAFEVYGVTRHFEGTSGERFEQEHIMWSDKCDFVSSEICAGFDGVWYGIWNNGDYMIARDRSDTTGNNLEKYIIPAGTYAAFETERGGYAGDELPKLHDLIFNSWLPNCEYTQTNNLEIEVYHLRADETARKKERYYEIWIPVKMSV